MAVTVIKNADWAIVWQAQPGRHVYMRGIDVAFDGQTITHVGKDYAGAADTVIDGSKRMVMPGLVNLHSHPEHEPAYRGVREEHGLPNMYMSGLFERSQAFYATDDAFRAASAEFAYCELLKSGVTTLIDISPAWDGWSELLAKSGLRAFLAPGYASGRWKLENDFELKYSWDEQAGKERFEAALKLIDAAVGHPCGRLSGVVSPMQIDTCTAELLAGQSGGGPGPQASLHGAHCPGGLRGDGDDPAARQDPHSMGGRDRPARADHHPRACHLPRQPFLGAMVDQERSQADCR